MYLEAFGMQHTGRQLAQYNNLFSQAISTSFKRLSSGKNIEEPQDDVTYFMTLSKIDQDNRAFSHIQTDLAKGSAMMNVAEDAGQQIVDEIKRMKELVDLYWDDSATAEDQTAYESEFNSIKSNIDAIINNTFYEDKQLIQNTGVDYLTRMLLDPDAWDTSDTTRDIRISFDANDVVATGGMDITNTDLATAMAAVDTQYDSALSYLTKASSYKHSIDSQLSLSSSIMESNNEYAASINEVDEAAEMMELVTAQIRQQATLSMMTQANATRQGMLALLE